MADVLYFPDGGREVIFGDPEEALRKVIYERLGRDAEEMYKSVIADIKHEFSPEGRDDYERIADGYRNMLVDVMNELHEAISQPRLNRKSIERIYRNLDKNL